MGIHAWSSLEAEPEAGPECKRASPAPRTVARAAPRPIGGIVPAAADVLLVVWLAGPIAWIAHREHPTASRRSHRCRHG